jgi:hypothetical protein
MIRPGLPGRTLALMGYWDYDPLSDAQFWPLRDGELHSFLFQGRKSTIHDQIIYGFCTTLINLSPTTYWKGTKK